jgi:hypothetical protein
LAGCLSGFSSLEHDLYGASIDVNHFGHVNVPRSALRFLKLDRAPLKKLFEAKTSLDCQRKYVIPREKKVLSDFVRFGINAAPDRRDQLWTTYSGRLFDIDHY